MCLAVFPIGLLFTVEFMRSGEELEEGHKLSSLDPDMGTVIPGPKTCVGLAPLWENVYSQ